MKDDYKYRINKIQTLLTDNEYNYICDIYCDKYGETTKRSDYIRLLLLVGAFYVDNQDLLEQYEDMIYKGDNK